MQLSICFIFWIFVAPEFFLSVSIYWKLGLTSVHTIPAAFCIINYYLTDIPMLKTDFWHTLAIQLLYTRVNYYFFHYYGDMPVYPFMTWSDKMGTVMACFACWYTGFVVC